MFCPWGLKDRSFSLERTLILQCSSMLPNRFYQIYFPWILKVVWKPFRLTDKVYNFAHLVLFCDFIRVCFCNSFPPLLDATSILECICYWAKQGKCSVEDKQEHCRFFLMFLYNRLDTISVLNPDNHRELNEGLVEKLLMKNLGLDGGSPPFPSFCL